MGPESAFDRAYAQDVVGQQAVPPRAAAAVEPAETFVGADGFAVGGCVITPTERVDDGFVTVGPDGTVTEVGTKRPTSVPVLDTGGVVLPGMIDLHGHPEFNVFAPWEPPDLFANRYEWRGSDVYHRLIREPQDHLLGALPPGTEERYAQIRALVTGVTAIQGANGQALSEDDSLVRHVDQVIFGTHRARSIIDLPADATPQAERMNAVLADIGAGKVDTLYLHLAEGRADDALSAGEFDRLVSLGALTPATVVIHGTAMGRDQLGGLADGGAKLVWSPQSELRLYGEATRAADALDVSLPLGLGADWLPSGSLSLLAELKVARRVLSAQGRAVDDRELVAMVTSVGATVAGLGDRLGTISPGRAADVVVLERHHDDPWHNVVEAEPAWVQLVSVGGRVRYGRAELVTALDPTAPDRVEHLVAWGNPMLLDTSGPASTTAGTPRSLSELRRTLVAQFPQTGPIFA